ncbi:LysR family transcriptional regulator [Cupriavidus sp. WKF15]|uniref:LysR family transcriptional regulator n=1 Tax=Cupriavidus sp. WKF15 TaxID=3032282 RepID=UPI0023E135B0|nr:LysR family transcriptional regulator [Cupriavidus sp. WKF15]WER49377.1 LysR family transcriptional regulator [Cupriavidus sp. WKF15]
MTSKISWELYRSLLGVLRTGSLSGAARELGLSQPTVGRHIDSLEQELGAILFTRSQSGLLPTEAALTLRDYAEAMESTAAAMERTVTGAGGDVSGTVRISASEVVGIEVLPPVLAALRAQHPALVIELVLSNRIHDLLRREADVAVRMRRPVQEQLVARRVGAIELGLYAHEDYLARHGVPRDAKALRSHALIGYDQSTPFIREAARSLPWPERAAFALRADSDVAQLSLIRAGAGIGICQTGLAARQPALRRLLPRKFSMRLETWITMHESLRHSLACRTVFDALADGLGTYIAAQ